MKPKVIGVTTEYANIAKMLGVENEKEYGLYQETQMGKYYARFLADGTFEEKVVHLISYEQANKLESIVASAIKEADQNVQEVIVSSPVINMNCFNKGMENIHRQSKAKAEEMGQDIRSNLERAGFHPTYANN